MFVPTPVHWPGTGTQGAGMDSGDIGFWLYLMVPSFQTGQVKLNIVAMGFSDPQFNNGTLKTPYPVLRNGTCSKLLKLDCASE